METVKTIFIAVIATLFMIPMTIGAAIVNEAETQNVIKKGE